MAFGPSARCGSRFPACSRTWRPGGPFHAVAEQGIPFRQVAEVIGRQFQLPVVSMSQEEALAHFGMMAMFIGGNGPASSERTRELLGWVPEEASLLADISQPEYFPQEAVSTDIFSGRQR